MTKDELKDEMKGVNMFEKEAEKAGNEKIRENNQFARCARKSYKDGFKEGAEFGYNKCNTELEKENAKLKSKNCWKTCEYAEPKSQWISQHIQDVEQLTKAKEIIKKFSEFVNNEVEFDSEHPQEHTDLWNELCEKAEQFLRGNE